MNLVAASLSSFGGEGWGEEAFTILGLVASKSNRDYIAAEELRCELSESMEFLKTPELRSFRLDTSRMSFYDKLKFDANGLVPAIIQELGSGRVLMMAWMNRASLEKTIATGKTHFWSRSRQKFWMKGESSGHTQAVKNIALDCDGDTLLIQVEQIGAACHEGYRSCFFRSVTESGSDLQTTEAQLETPEKIYGKK